MRFALSVFKFRFGFRVEQDKQNASSLSELIRITAIDVAMAIVVAWGLLYVDAFLRDARLLPDWIAKSDPQSYDAFLTSAAQIGGVFIGLYYAGLTAVGSAFYAKTPSNLRGVFMQERIGNIYMSFLGFATFLAIALIGLRSVGYPPIALAVPTVVLMFGVGVMAFVHLGNRALGLLDPTALALPVLYELEKWVREVTVNGPRFRDAAFQNHALRSSVECVETLKVLSDTAEKQPHLSGRSFVGLAERIIGSSIRYLKHKSTIPNSSRWYKQKYEHGDWYRSEDIRTEVAGRTGTTLEPERVKNYLWLEEETSQIVLRAFQANIRADRYDLAMELCAYLHEWFKNLGQQGELAYAAELSEKVYVAVTTILPTVSQVGAPVRVEHLALVEQMAALPISAALGFLSSAESSDYDELGTQLATIDWTDSKALYRVGFRRSMLDRAEWLQERLNFEKAVEGHTISPLWYQLAQLNSVVARTFADNGAVVLNRFVRSYERWITEFLRLGQIWYGSAVLSRQWEYLNKLEARLDSALAYWDTVDRKQKIEGLPFPIISKEGIGKKIVREKRKALERMARMNLVLASENRSSELPDYAGQFLHASGDELVQALLGNDDQAVSRVFPSFFWGSLKRFDSLRPKPNVTFESDSGAFAIACAPILDLLEISGYAILLSEFYAKPALAEKVVSTWEKYLSSGAEPHPVRTIAAAIHLGNPLGFLPHRGTVRINWRMAVAQKLRSLPHRRVVRGRDFIAVDEVPVHDSPLVRVVAADRTGMFYMGVDIAIERLLKSVPVGSEVDFGRSHRDLGRAIQREIHRGVVTGD